jgi:DNA-directed RNA polymerase subunit M/transcription elongation factor TFIIS
MTTYEDFEMNCDINLNSFIKKKSNRIKISKILWKLANQDYEYANYLSFEIFCDYMCVCKLNDIKDNIKNKKIGWFHTFFDQYKLKQKEYDDFLINPPDVEEGVIECHKCGSKKTYSFSKQTRSADESTTVFVRCSQCNNTFKF